MALPLISARYPQPSRTVNTIGFVFLFIARQNTRIRSGVVVKPFNSAVASFPIMRLHRVSGLRMSEFCQLLAQNFFAIITSPIVNNCSLRVSKNIYRDANCGDSEKGTQ